MLKLALAFFVVGLSGAAWLIRPMSQAPANAVAVTPPTHERVAPPLAQQEQQQQLVAQPRPRLDGDALRRRVDEQIPSRLYGAAAACYHGGLPADQHLDLAYHLHVSDGAVSITTARVEATTVGSRTLESCIVERVLAAHFRDEELPDMERDDELFVRVGGFKPYLARVASNGDDPAQD